MVSQVGQRGSQAVSHLILLGDMQLGRKVDEGLSHGAEGCRRVWGNLLPTLNGSQDVPDASCLQEAPLVAGNLETAITTETRKLPKAFNFKMSPSNIPALKWVPQDTSWPCTGMADILTLPWICLDRLQGGQCAVCLSG